MRRRSLGGCGLVLLAALFWAGAARADVLPEPGRPGHWDEHPAPTPEVPLEETLARRLLPLLALGMAGCTALAAARRGRVLSRAGRR
ncbi:hypothetical protein [Polyangium sp. 15x6]|uniref:hypothetical protein n=1 Tax=Polyangium sp. 15x6 TaxID=3042687 RepID=UPI00249C3D71|nr:hypothetical protein [Polyangium sp. 15x6]MDI3291384.1 hypothetical protein [Polyangium sp. 15x6]